MASAVRFRSAVALAGSYPVLAGLDLEVEAGEVVALRGANGAGKTSVLRACAGLLAVTAGEAVVLGVALCGAERAGQAAMSGLRRRIGLLGHVTGLYDDLTVEANVTFALRAAGAGGRSGEGAARAGAAIERMGLGGRLATTAVGRLSAGQRRRTALAVLVARSPELWLLDEPHAGLDSEHRDILDAVVGDAVAGGATVVLASHEAGRAANLAGRTVTVAGGTVVAGMANGARGPAAPAAAPAPFTSSSAASPVRGAVHVA